MYRPICQPWPKFTTFLDKFWFYSTFFFSEGAFLIAIVHRDLRIAIFFSFVTFHLLSIFYLDFYFPFSTWTFIPFSIWTFILFLDFYFFLGLLFPFLHKSRSDLGFLPSFFFQIKSNQIKSNQIKWIKSQNGTTNCPLTFPIRLKSWGIVTWFTFLKMKIPSEISPSLSSDCCYLHQLLGKFQIL